MKLADIKKLKVADLRSRLKELGLESCGLKAELVERLWSAAEGGHSGRDGEREKVKLQDNSPTPPVRMEPVDVHPPSAEAGVTGRHEVDRAYTDMATQTEPEPDPTAPQPGSEAAATAFPSEGAEQGHAEGPGEEDMGRGRSFYEFKEEIRYKRAKSPQLPLERSEAEEQDEDKVRLDPYGSHLHFEVGPDGSCGQPRFWARFPLLWSGCRLTHGVQQGRVGFEVRLERKLLSIQPDDQQARELYGLRVGWSVADSTLLLGEDKLSFAYDGRGKKVSAGQEEEFGEPFSEGDIIGCYASFSSDSAVELSFHKNGRFMGVAFSVGASVLLGRTLFPHVLCKSCSVRLLLDPAAQPWYPGPPGFTPLATLPAGQRMRSTAALASRAQCEVVLMVGLPGSGKSVWARNYMKQHPEKQHRLLGTEELLTCMISGGETDSRLQQASQCLTEMIKMAAKTHGNYILDQCNILFSALRHKLRLFTGFRRRVVVVFPSADEWKRRLSQHQTRDGEHIPETALLKLQVSCSLPEQQDDLLEELQYVELPQEDALKLLQEYKDEARRLLPPIPKQKKGRRLYRKRLRPPYSIPLSHRISIEKWSQQPRYWSVPYQDQGYYYNVYESYS
ncbi:heterogeneous nuclear ribonucleoprotein U-like protein 2 isoform X2 [Archocentrus centrarchus]|uniref:heterogeneous nuclear ribonucleoprotein U-like protein 2 isoform X2 n=1 Tax=Archocentrus centrarchus TaxID=63155 RepID=UPI0011E9FFE7|nr:heterogeneous nuclear ribonucleoprotein U-like protein 2 isoform X2 [Archocentrus centrarchus]